jgi:hypothetical protein
MIREENLSPRPVTVMLPMMIPAVAQAAATSGSDGPFLKSLDDFREGDARVLPEVSGADGRPNAPEDRPFRGIIQGQEVDEQNQGEKMMTSILQGGLQRG